MPPFVCRYEQACSRRALTVAWEQLDRRTCAEARERGAGVDGVTVALWAQDADERLTDLWADLVRGTYQAERALACTIGPPGHERQLLIPTIRDRIVQGAARAALQRVWEPEFLSCSHGFRPGRSTQTAIAQVLVHARHGRRWALKTDVRDCFDSIYQGLLLALLETTADTRLVALVRQWLPQGGRGIPQGAAISPLLCNIYLHLFDLAMVAGGWPLVRYADDLVVLCDEATGCWRAIGAVQEALGSIALQIAAEKTTIAPLNALGFLGATFEGNR